MKPFLSFCTFLALTAGRVIAQPEIPVLYSWTSEYGSGIIPSLADPENRVTPLMIVYLDAANNDAVELGTQTRADIDAALAAGRIS